MGLAGRCWRGGPDWRPGVWALSLLAAGVKLSAENDSNSSRDATNTFRAFPTGSSYRHLTMFTYMLSTLYLDVSIT
jgi:hypothetical protein